MRTTKIGRTQSTWNPIRGCTPASEGCDHCYAKRMALRFGDKNFRPQTIPKRLDEPLKWRKPRMVFVGSMGDLFHEDISTGFIQSVFTIMANARQHIFQILTKRPNRMLKILTHWESTGLLLRSGFGCTLPNVWLGVIAENQQTADERIPLLLQTPAALRYVSCEPLFEPINLNDLPSISGIGRYLDSLSCAGIVGSEILGKLDWVIVGGETGPGARECREEWVSNICEQCQAADVPFFFKQAGARWKREYSDWCFRCTPNPKDCVECRGWKLRREWPNAAKKKT